MFRLGSRNTHVISGRIVLRRPNAARQRTSQDYFISSSRFCCIYYSSLRKNHPSHTLVYFSSFKFTSNSTISPHVLRRRHGSRRGDTRTFLHEPAGRPHQAVPLADFVARQNWLPQRVHRRKQRRRKTRVMTVLVVGATGKTGRLVVERLLHRNYEV